jgi:hypothetical protein
MLAGKGETRRTRILTVTGSSTAGAADGQVAIVLETKENGAIGFLVTLDSCAGLRRDIAAAEEFLRQKPGRA